jgi:uncharacterized membrane protein
MLKVIAAIMLVPFGAFSAWVLWPHGYWAIWQAGLASPPAMQLLADLVIACSLGMMWLWHDARQRGRNAWPYLAITLAAGSFGLLLYLLLAPANTRAAVTREGVRA